MSESEKRSTKVSQSQNTLSKLRSWFSTAIFFCAVAVLIFVFYKNFYSGDVGDSCLDGEGCKIGLACLAEGYCSNTCESDADCGEGWYCQEANLDESSFGEVLESEDFKVCVRNSAE